MAHEQVKFKVTLNDSSGAWFGHQVAKMTTASRSMAVEILSLSRLKAPRKSGAMANGAMVVSRPKSAAVVYPGPYSGYQERGSRYDGTRVVKNYTTPNTGAHYLEPTGKDVVKRGIKWFLSHS